MDRKYIDMHVLTDRYLRGTLPEEEKAEFEERIVWDRDLVDELDIAERLREGLRQSVAEDKYTVSDSTISFMNRLSGLFSVPQYAAAASFALATILMGGLFMSPIGHIENGSDSRPGVTEIIPLFATRSNNVPTIAVTENAWTVLLLDVAGTYDSYRVSVRADQSGAVAFFSENQLPTTYPESIAVGMPSDLLVPGRYVLSIEGERETDSGEIVYEHIQNITFETASAD
jgi:hypothetical protein